MSVRITERTYRNKPNHFQNMTIPVRKKRTLCTGININLSKAQINKYTYIYIYIYIYSYLKKNQNAQNLI